MTLSLEYLRSLLDYNPTSGIFTWRVYRNSYAGQVAPGRVAGSPSGGYVLIIIDQKKYRAHRLAWFYFYGTWPVGHIDHRDLIRSNNAIENLREATNSQNMANGRSRRSGLKGAYKFDKTTRWLAQICVMRKTRYLGIFETEIEAHEAYMRAAREAHGEFARA